ncbi:MAG: hypothetical protein LBE27_02445, partial [Deltaproteobacteria bacterium]|nr:hypothetical protein [Deltaproteobacteria bacterium]
MSKKMSHAKNSLERLLRYALGVQPDEFGLVLSSEGFVPIKELVAALKDEEGYRGLNETRIKDVINEPGNRDYELVDKLLRLDPSLAKLPPEAEGEVTLPKELHVGLKEGAWRSAFFKGLYPKNPTEGQVRLFVDKEKAQKVAKRFAPEVILVRVMAQKAKASGVNFSSYGNDIWLTPFVPQEFLIGPKIKIDEEIKEDLKPKSHKEGLASIPEPGLIASPLPSKGKKKGKYSDSPEWKTQTRKDRRG